MALTEPLYLLLQQPWLGSFSEREKSALVAKLMRYQVIEPCRALASNNTLSQSDAYEASRVLAALSEFSQRAADYLSRHDAKAVWALVHEEPSVAERALSSLPSLASRAITQDPWLSVAPESYLRRGVRQVLHFLRLRQ